VKYGSFSGFISHYHVSKNKIDCAGMDIKALLEEAQAQENTGYISSSDSCTDDS
jgi:hypothetical protein